MWILHLLPDAFIAWIVNLILLAGVLATVAGFFVKFIPLVNTYRLPIQIGGILILTLGVYFKGGYSTEIAWRERVAEVEARIKAAEAESQNQNVRIETKVVTRTQLVREQGAEVIRYVDKEIVKYDTKFAPGGQCEIPAEFVKAHNDAAEAPKK